MEANVESTYRSFSKKRETKDPYRAKVTDEVTFESDEFDFGQYLRTQRVLRGITREEILRVTKVSDEYYDALESNRLGELPPKAFVIGFLKVLSDYAGLNSDEVINHFLAQYHRLVVRAVDEPSPPKISLWRKFARRWLTVAGALSLIALMFAPLFRH